MILAHLHTLMVQASSAVHYHFLSIGWNMWSNMEHVVIGAAALDYLKVQVIYIQFPVSPMEFTSE